MKVVQTNYGMDVDILFNLDPYTARPIMVSDEEVAAVNGKKIVKAGTPLDKAGKAANGATARYVLLKDFGTGSECTSADFTYWPNWGIEDETVPLSAGARQSLIDTLITYSYDRATAGYSTCTVKLHADTKALLTQDEIAQMTAKGYTLA